MATFQARFDLPRFFIAVVKLRLLTDLLMRQTCGSHTKKLITARTDHTPSDPRHPDSKFSANGKLIPAATAAPTPKNPEYKLVTKPDLCGKFRFTNPGINTFPSAMTTPKSAVPI